jgi:hypothetical protein
MRQDGQSRLKNWSMSVLGFLLMIVALVVVSLFLRGMVWAFDKVLPWLNTASEIAFGICVFVVAPLCIPRKTRPWAGVAFVYASFLFGAMLFAYACLFVVYVWGYVGLVIGLIFAGVGVVPVALLAALLHANWSVLFDLAFGVVLTFGTRWLGMRLTEVPSQEDLQQSASQEPDPVRLGPYDGIPFPDEDGANIGSDRGGSDISSKPPA